MKCFLRYSILVSMAVISQSIFAYTFESGGIYYNIYSNESKILEVTYGVPDYWQERTDYVGDITIPATVNYQGTDYTVGYIGRNAFTYCLQLTSIILPSTILSIENWAFCNCYGLVSVTIPDGCKEIGYKAFCKCESLISIVIPNSVTIIGEDAFRGCSSLREAVLPNQLSSISNTTFRFCTSLLSITIPKSVKSINLEAFLDCRCLREVRMETDTPPTIKYNSFTTYYPAWHYTIFPMTLYVPKGSAENYRKTENWDKFSKIIEMP